ncbi:MAG: type IV pilus modification protein PilV [Candidatus Eutrophobiaceae bacterium]
MSASSRSVARALTHGDGFTLYEVLISMLILSIGVLGVAAMQFKGLQYNQDAFFRSQMSLLAWEFTERIRMNSAAIADYAALGTWTVPENAGSIGSCNPLIAGDAAKDLDCWKAEMARLLPPGSVAKVRSGVNDAYVLDLVWTDREGNDRTVKISFRE